MLNFDKNVTKMKPLKTAALMLAATISLTAAAERVVILHTNDTHSQIDPTAEGLGGILRRKVLIDSIRNAEPNVILVDAGDAVQGSLFFTLFKGEVEQKMMNALGYDIQIVGNHEFDNGLEALKRQYDMADAQLLATNYDFSDTPLAGMFRPFTIKETGGKRYGFFAVNIDPEGLIEGSSYTGLKYLDAATAADAMAWYLKNIEKVDKVIAITHIGYDDINGINDVDLARRSHDIDIIIGGHSHTLVDPDSPKARIANADGREVLVLQTKNKGMYLGEITLDTDTDTAKARLITVDSRLDSRIDRETQALLTPYRHKVDSISAIKISKAATDFPADSPRLLNWLSDYVKSRGEEMTGQPVDLAIMNKGGIRNSLTKGAVTKGQILTMLPFRNDIVVIELSGRDLLDNLEIMGRQNGNGVSGGTAVTFEPGTGRILNATVNGSPIDPERTYRVATISYLAKGGDYMVPLTHGRIVAQSDSPIYDDIIRAMESGSLKGTTMRADNELRMKPAAVR